MAALVFFAALSLNLLVNFALGIKELVQRERAPAVLIYYPWIILFVSTLLLWVFFARILFFVDLDFLLVLPLSVLGSQELEKFFFRCFLPGSSFLWILIFFWSFRFRYWEAKSWKNSFFTPLQNSFHALIRKKIRGCFLSVRLTTAWLRRRCS